MSTRSSSPIPMDVASTAVQRPLHTTRERSRGKRVGDEDKMENAPTTGRFLRAMRREVYKEVRERGFHYLDLLAYVDSTVEWRGRNGPKKNKIARENLKRDFIWFELKMAEGDDISTRDREAWYVSIRNDFLGKYPKS